MRIKIVDNSIYITEQNCIGGKQVGIVCPELWFAYGSITKIYIRGKNSKHDNYPLVCKTIQNLNTYLIGVV